MIGKAKYEVTHDTIKKALEEYMQKQHTKALKVSDASCQKDGYANKWIVELEFIEPCVTDSQSITESAP